MRPIFLPLCLDTLFSAIALVYARGAPDSGVQPTRRSPEVHSGLGRGSKERAGRRPLVGQRVCVSQSERELSETRGLGSHGVVSSGQAARAWEVSPPGGGAP